MIIGTGVSVTLAVNFLSVVDTKKQHFYTPQTKFGRLYIGVTLSVNRSVGQLSGQSFVGFFAYNVTNLSSKLLPHLISHDCN